MRLRRILSCLLAAALTACSGREDAEATRTPGGRGDAGSAGQRRRVILVGIDGADWRVIDPLLNQGRLPSFSKLKKEGATGVLMSMEPSASPSLWTTVATGVGPERHGIHGFVADAGGEGGRAGKGEEDRRPRGRAGDEDAAPAAPRRHVRPVTSAMRRAPAFWNVLPGFGLKAGVVGWLVTWPAERVDGFIVSSYLPYIYNWSTGRPLKGTIVEGIPRQTHPEDLIETIDPLKVKPADLDETTLRRFYDPTRAARLSSEDRECVEGFRWSLACDETYRRVGLRLFDGRPADLFAIYFGGVDVASHRFWKYAYPEALRYGVGAEEAAILGRVIDEYYVYVDGLVGEYLERMRPEDTLVVLSDHGFRPVLLPGRPATSGHHRPEGIIALYGAAAKRGHSLRQASLLDVLPTVLAILGVPVSMDLEGRVLQEALDPQFALGHPVEFIERYEVEDRAGGPVDSDLDANVLERLRSLGYIN